MRSITRVLVVLCLFSTLHFMTPAAFATKISMPTLVTEPTNRTKISMPTLVTEPTNRTKISMPTLLRDGYPEGETRAVGVSSIPTLSEWGVIMMAGLMGLAGLIVTVRRQRALRSS